MSRPIDIRRIEVIDDEIAAAFRAMTPAKRIAIGLGQHEFAKKVRAAGALALAARRNEQSDAVSRANNHGVNATIDMSRIEVIDDQAADALRAMGGTARLAMLDQLCRSAKEIMACGVRTRNPDWSDAQVQQEIARRVLNAAS